MALLMIVKGLLDDTIENYLKIGYLLCCLDENLLKKMGYENIYEFSKENFDLGVTSTKNFINVYRRFAITDSDENAESAIFHVNRIELKEEYNDYSLSQLVELLPVADSDLDKYNPDMTTKEIRLLKKQSQLTDYEQNFYALVEKRFKEIWSLVKLDDDITTVFNEETKLIFDNSGVYRFNLVYEKHRNTVTINTNVNLFNFSIEIESPTYNFNFEFLNENAIPLNEEIDCKAIADKFSNFINLDCKKFIEKMKRLKLKSCETDKVRSDLDKLITQICKDSKDKTYRLSDFNHGQFFDFIELLEKFESKDRYKLSDNYNKMINLEKEFPHAIFSRNQYKIVSFSRYCVTVRSAMEEPNLYFVINFTSNYFKMYYEFRNDNYNISFPIESALYMYPFHLKNYFDLKVDGCSLFSIYTQLAKLWVKTIKEVSKKEE